MRTWSISFVLAGLLAAACGGALPETGDPGAGRARVEIPSSDAALLQSLTAQTLNGTAQLDSDGLATLDFGSSADAVRFAMVSHDDMKKAVMFGYQFPASVQSGQLQEFVDHGQGMRINARSTALAMVMINPLLFDASLEQRVMIAEEAVAGQNFETLVREIETHKTINPLEPISYETTPDLFYHSSRTTIAAMRTIADRLPDAQPQDTFEPQAGVSIDTDMAYPVIQNGTVVIYNPKMVYYVVGTRVPEAVNWVDDVPPYGTPKLTLIPGKERALDVSIFPPKFQVVPPVQVPLASGYDARYFYIYKGFQFDMSRSELNETPPARLALAANTWASFSMMMAMVGDISQMIPYVGGFTEWLSDHIVTATKFENLMGAVQSRDRNDTVIKFQDLFSEMGPAINTYFQQNFAGGGLGNIMNILGGVVSLISGGSMVNMIIDLTTQVLPFYYDLFTAHSTAVYPYFNGAVQEVPNSPVTGQIFPEQVVNGRPIYLNGYGYGARGPNSKLLIDGVQIADADIGSWEPSQIIAWVPWDLQGTAANTPTGKAVTIQVINNDGTQTPPVTKAFNYDSKATANGGSEEGGGGGCSAARTTSAAGAWQFAFAMLAVVALGVRLRRAA